MDDIKTIELKGDGNIQLGFGLSLLIYATFILVNAAAIKYLLT